MSSVPRLDTIQGAFESLFHREAYPYLGRSLYDIGLREAVGALALQDEALPLLSSNALRRVLAIHAGDLATQWLVCGDFTESACEQAAANPESYAAEVVNATRNTPQYDESRKGATGMVFLGGSDVYECTAQAMTGYGMLAAFERHTYDGVDTTHKIVASFGVRNVFGINIRGDWGNERVHPALVLNSAIETVLISYDMEPNSHGYSFVARHFVLEPDSGVAQRVLIKEHRELKAAVDTTNQLKTATANDFETIGSVSTEEDGSFKIDSPPYYQEKIAEMLER